MPGGRRILGAAVVALLLAGCTARPDPVPHTASPSSSSGAPLVVAALGDSISRGFDACDHYGDCLEASWSTGSDPRVDSVATRLERSTGRSVRAVDLARTGARVADLGAQVEAAIAHRPDVVTVLIGANDACSATLDGMTSTAGFASAAAGALDRLTAALPHTTVLVASVPDVAALPSIAGGDPTARWVWSRLDCATALADPPSDSPAAIARRAAVHARILAYDAGLQTACSTHARCVDDGGALTSSRPALADLSPLDFFHPSVPGLARIAGIEWARLRTTAATR